MFDAPLLETICEEESDPTLLGAMEKEYGIAELMFRKVEEFKAAHPSVYEEIASMPSNFFSHEKLQAAWEWGAKGHQLPLFISDHSKVLTHIHVELWIDFSAV